MTPLKENLERLESAIEQACRRAGRPRGDVELMAVSKTYPAATICEAASLGLRSVRRKPRAGVRRQVRGSGRASQCRQRSCPGRLHRHASHWPPAIQQVCARGGTLRRHRLARFAAPRRAPQRGRRKARQASAGTDRSETESRRDQVRPRSRICRSCATAGAPARSRTPRRPRPDDHRSLGSRGRRDPRLLSHPARVARPLGRGSSAALARTSFPWA